MRKYILIRGIIGPDTDMDLSHLGLFIDIENARMAVRADAVKLIEERFNRKVDDEEVHWDPCGLELVVDENTVHPYGLELVVDKHIVQYAIHEIDL